MKKIFSVLIAASIALSAGAQSKYGKEFKTENAIEVNTLEKKMKGKTEMDNVVVVGELSKVCQAEGCWVKLKNEGGEDVLVKFKDHAFLVPKDLTGTVVVTGRATKKVISVKERKHMAEDAGASASDIEMITEPKEELRIEATGLVVKQ